MRVNQFIAHATGLSRRAADTAVAAGRVRVNDQLASAGQQVGTDDTVQLDKRVLTLPSAYQTIVFNKPKGYVTSRRRQGTGKTIYTLLPDHFHRLKPVGRLDKDSSGLLLLTDDGDLAQTLQHPSAGKIKRYRVGLDRPLDGAARERIQAGVRLSDGLSRLQLVEEKGKTVEVELVEGRNRQVRRTFEVLGYTVVALHRTHFGDVTLDGLKEGAWRPVELRP